MLSSRTLLLAMAALAAAMWSPNGDARAASPSSSQLLQRSMLVMRSVRSAHSQSTIQLVGLTAGGKVPEVITARISADCSGTRSPTHFAEAIRATIRGTVVIGKGLPRAMNTHYIFLSSGSSTGSNTHTVFWERDATRTNRWRTVSTVIEEPAYAAFLEADSCGTGGEAFRMAQGGHLRPPTTATSAGRRAWAIRGTSGRSAELFTFRMLIDRATYRLDGVIYTYAERVNRRVAVRWQVTTTYSSYDASFAIKAPVAGSRTP